MGQQLKFIGIGAAVAGLGVGIFVFSQGGINSLNTAKRDQTDSTRNARGRYQLNSTNTTESITASLPNEESGTKTVTRRRVLDQDGTTGIDPRGQMQEIVDQKINELSPIRKRILIEKSFPISVKQKPKTGIKNVYKSRTGIVLKKEFSDGRVKYFDKDGGYLKQKNKDGSWEFKTGYSTTNDWHLKII